MAPQQDEEPAKPSVEVTTKAWSTVAAEQLGAKIGGLLLGRSTQNDAELNDIKEANVKLKTQLQGAVDELRELRLTCRHLEQAASGDQHEIELLRADISYVAERWNEQKKQLTKLENEYQKAQHACHDTKKKLHSEEAEKRKLLDQVAQFKKVISSSSQTENQVSDDVIHAKSEHIFYAIQAFVVKHFRGTKFDYVAVSQDAKNVMREYAPTAEQLPKASWLNILNSMIAQIMLDGFAPKNYFGETLKFPVGTIAKFVQRLQGDIDPKWIIATRKMLSETAPDVLKAADLDFAGYRANIFNRVLKKAVSVQWTDEMRHQLVDLFDRAQDFYRLAFAQQSELQVYMPKAMVDIEAQPFNPKTMEIVNGGGEDETAFAGYPIEISVFPAVYKRGGTSSANGDGFTVVSKAKVVLHK